MKIVDRKTFLALPAGTVFAKFGGPSDYTYRDIAIKGDTSSGVDFWAQEIGSPWFAGAESSDDYFTIHDAMLKGEKSPAVDYETEARDGLFDEDQLFAVWEREDLTQLISRLRTALRDGYGDAE